jgi:lysophospholipase
MIDDLASNSDHTTLPDARVRAIETADGTQLRVALWSSRSLRPSGTVVLVQGRSEFIEKYLEVIGELLGRGFAVVSFDFRGQGGSSRMLRNRHKGHIDDFALYMRDIDAVLHEMALNEIMAPGCPKPWFGLAHSMGASVLLLMLEEGESRLERVVLVSPMVELGVLPAARFARILATTLNFLGFGGCYVPGGGDIPISKRKFEGNRLSSDPVRYEQIRALIRTNPDLSVGDPTIGWVEAAFRAMARFAEPLFGSNLRTPSLILAGGADRLCKPGASLGLASRLRLGAGIDIAGARHELLMERDPMRAQFWDAFDAFIPGETGARAPALGDQTRSKARISASELRG